MTSTSNIYDCDKCGNRGYTLKTKYGMTFAVMCKCEKIRRSLRAIEQSGLSGTLETYTFERFIAKEDWQKSALSAAMNYLENPEGWFGFFGQVGCGKSMLCTAICGEFLKAGKDVRYMPWRDDVMKLKANVMDDVIYGKMMRTYKNADVLYIDDLFKTEAGKKPTQADINIAFELLNYRYNNRGLITILSSEKQLDELIEIDEAVGSRIYERCKNQSISIKKNASKNYRTRK